MPASAALSYDSLPPHGTLVRETVPGGAVKITAAAGSELTPELHRELLFAAAVYAAILSALALSLCFLVFGALVYEHRRELPWWTAIIFAVFCAALFGLIWRMAYSGAIGRAEHALAQSTVMLVEPGRLLIESVGPLGAVSHELRAAQITRIAVVRDLHLLRPSSSRLGANHILIELNDRDSIAVLAGRASFEIDWAAQILRQILGVQPSIARSQVF